MFRRLSRDSKTRDSKVTGTVPGTPETQPDDLPDIPALQRRISSTDPIQNAILGNVEAKDSSPQLTKATRSPERASGGPLRFLRRRSTKQSRAVATPKPAVAEKAQPPEPPASPKPETWAVLGETISTEALTPIRKGSGIRLLSKLDHVGAEESPVSMRQEESKIVQVVNDLSARESVRPLSAELHAEGSPAMENSCGDDLFAEEGHELSFEDFEETLDDLKNSTGEVVGDVKPATQATATPTTRKGRRRAKKEAAAQKEASNQAKNEAKKQVNQKLTRIVRKSIKDKGLKPEPNVTGKISDKETGGDFSKLVTKVVDEETIEVSKQSVSHIVDVTDNEVDVSTSLDELKAQEIIQPEVPAEHGSKGIKFEVLDNKPDAMMTYADKFDGMDADKAHRLHQGPRTTKVMFTETVDISKVETESSLDQEPQADDVTPSVTVENNPTQTENNSSIDSTGSLNVSSARDGETMDFALTAEEKTHANVPSPDSHVQIAEESNLSSGALKKASFKSPSMQIEHNQSATSVISASNAIFGVTTTLQMFSLFPNQGDDDSLGACSGAPLPPPREPSDSHRNFNGSASYSLGSQTENVRTGSEISGSFVSASVFSGEGDFSREGFTFSDDDTFSRDDVSKKSKVESVDEVTARIQVDTQGGPTADGEHESPASDSDAMTEKDDEETAMTASPTCIKDVRSVIDPYSEQSKVKQRIAALESNLNQCSLEDPDKAPLSNQQLILTLKNNSNGSPVYHTFKVDKFNPDLTEVAREISRMLSDEDSEAFPVDTKVTITAERQESFADKSTVSRDNTTGDSTIVTNETRLVNKEAYNGEIEKQSSSVFASCSTIFCNAF